jgi:hypothetical protein
MPGVICRVTQLTRGAPVEMTPRSGSCHCPGASDCLLLLSRSSAIGARLQVVGTGTKQQIPCDGRPVHLARVDGSVVRG